MVTVKTVYSSWCPSGVGHLPMMPVKAAVNEAHFSGVREKRRHFEAGYT